MAIPTGGPRARTATDRYWEEYESFAKAGYSAFNRLPGDWLHFGPFRKGDAGE